MFNQLKPVIKKETTKNKTFNFSKDKVRLDFTLRVDVKQQLLDFLEILKEAEKSVSEEINKRFN